MTLVRVRFGPMAGHMLSCVVAADGCWPDECSLSRWGGPDGRVQVGALLRGPDYGSVLRGPTFRALATRYMEERFRTGDRVSRTVEFEAPAPPRISSKPPDPAGSTAEVRVHVRTMTVRRHVFDAAGRPTSMATFGVCVAADGEWPDLGSVCLRRFNGREYTVDGHFGADDYADVLRSPALRAAVERCFEDWAHWAGRRPVLSQNDLTVSSKLVL